MSNERHLSYISRKMRVLSLFAAFAIVFLHSGRIAGLEKMDKIAIIPVYNPEPNLRKLCRALLDEG